MLFNSFEFLLFFPIVTILYFLLPHRFRWLHLLIASCIFYSFFIPIYILILFFTIIIDYYAGLMIEKASGRKRKQFLILSIVANVGVLAVFKYYNFFIGNVNEVIMDMGGSLNVPLLNIILPIGLSFHTFQAMSYTIEVYRGHQKAERHLGIYALYVMFYPQLVAGPIERPQNILHQFREKHTFQYDRVASGLRLMLWGLFKKIVIADRLAVVVDEVYNAPGEFHGWSIVIATIFFAIQIYCDFSGYSDVAIGSARVMGFDLMKNFDTPYFSRSISEFWRRWHISLSTWFKDYVYIPMGGNRVSKWRARFNLIITFLVSGIWHGANWTYVIWGFMHGVYLVIETAIKKPKEAFYQAVGLKQNSWFRNFAGVFSTFVLVGFGWVFFRANSMSDAKNMYARLFDFGSYDLTQLSLANPELAAKYISPIELISCWMVIVFLFVFERYGLPYFKSGALVKWPTPVRWSFYSLAILAILFFGVFSNNQFIYFQF